MCVCVHSSFLSRVSATHEFQSCSLHQDICEQETESHDLLGTPDSGPGKTGRGRKGGREGEEEGGEGGKERRRDEGGKERRRDEEGRGGAVSRTPYPDITYMCM